jgi:hypothetical protein
MGNPGIYMVPSEPSISTLVERSLDFGIEFPEIMERRGIHDSGGDVRAG